MKKVLFILAAAMMAATASAQVVTSRTYVKSKKATTWYGRIGMSVNNVAGANDVVEAIMDGEGKGSLGSRVGMDIDFGFQRPISNFGLYWGMELGIGTRGGSVKLEYEDEDGSSDGEEKGHITTWNVKYSPFTFGYKYAVTDDIRLDGHIGAYVSYDFAGKSHWDWGDNDTEELGISKLKDRYDFQAFDAGMQVGLGVWWKRFNLDFTYQRGFVPAAKVGVAHYIYNQIYGGYMMSGYDEHNIYSSNFMIRLGVAF